MNGHRAETLLIDADDTLWENNIYFERVIQKVQSLLSSLGVDPEGFRARLDQAERDHIVTHGYGTVNFTRSLVRTFEASLPQGTDATLKTQVQDLALGILNHPLEILHGVPETLAYLSGRHRLFLVTKGDHGEQTSKIDSSKLRPYFLGVEILAEKNTPAFRQLLEKHSLDADHTWMIGNSPRSDINPAISAGMNAVYIPHPHTWILEHEEPVRHPRLLEVERFSDLRAHF